MTTINGVNISSLLGRQRPKMISFSCPHCPNLLWNSLAAIQMHAVFKHPDLPPSQFKPVATTETCRVIGYDEPITDINLKDGGERGANQGNGEDAFSDDNSQWACSMCGDCFLSEEDATLHSMSNACGYNTPSFSSGYRDEMVFDLKETNPVEFETRYDEDNDESDDTSNSVDGGPPSKRFKGIKSAPPLPVTPANVLSKTTPTEYHTELLRIDGRTKRFPCPYPACSEVTGHLDAALGHLNTVHLRLSPYECTRCAKSFPSPSDLEGHALDAHELSLKINPKNGRVIEDGVVVRDKRRVSFAVQHAHHVNGNGGVLAPPPSSTPRAIKAPTQKDFDQRTEPYIIPIYNAGPRASHTRQISKYHALIVVQPPGMKTGVSCPFPGCDLTLRDTERISAHLSADHLDLQPYMCQFCGYRTSNPGSARSHRRHSQSCLTAFAKGATGKKKASKSVKCPVCLAYSENSDALLEHMEEAHEMGLRVKIEVEDVLEGDDYVTEDGIAYVNKNKRRRWRR